MAKALEVRDSWQRMKSNGEVLYVTESALFDVSVLTLNEPAVDLVELRLMEESRRLWITQSEIRFDQTRIVEKTYPLLVAITNFVAFPMDKAYVG